MLLYRGECSSLGTVAKEFELQVTDNMGEENGITHVVDNFMAYLYASDTLLSIFCSSLHW